MPATKAEIAYLEHRLAATISQCDNASGDCARAAHAGLVELYRYRLSALRKHSTGTMPMDALIEQAQEAGVICRGSLVSSEWWTESGNIRAVATAPKIVAYA